MPTTLTTRAVEKSTFIITAAFTDEDDAAVVPNSITWSLTDKDGNVVNSRSAESETPATSVDIVLGGDDLALTEHADNERILTVETDYDSSLGSGLALRDEVRFRIAPLANVS